MDNYSLIRQAVQNRSCMSGVYEGALRHFSPQALGRNEARHVNVMSYQYAGQTSTKPYSRLTKSLACLSASDPQNIARILP